MLFYVLILRTEKKELFLFHARKLKKKKTNREYKEKSCKKVNSIDIWIESARTMERLRCETSFITAISQQQTHTHNCSTFFFFCLTNKCTWTNFICFFFGASLNFIWMPFLCRFQYNSESKRGSNKRTDVDAVQLEIVQSLSN